MGTVLCTPEWTEMRNAGDVLAEGLDLLGLPHHEGHIRSFLVYLAELKKWNRAYSLTAIRNDRDIIVKHFLDSLLFLKVLPETCLRVADIGSGAGFPGIPMKILRPDLDMVLVEPAQKKARFLEHMQRTLGLENLRVIDRRIEDSGLLNMDAAVTRALFSIGDFILRAEDILAEYGLLILSKGPKVGRELTDITGRNITQIDITLPFEGIPRHLVLVRRRPDGKE